MKVALFFGSFNPVHVGHMIIASYILEHTDVDQLWMVVSPHNPHKKKASLAKDHDRLLENHHIYVYQRPTYDLGPLQHHPHVHILDAPLLQLSATMIRSMIKEGKSVKYYVPDSVNDYLGESTLYR